MNIFRRRPAARAAAPARSSTRAPNGRGRPDWRSYDGVADQYEELVAPHTSLIARDLVGQLGVRPGWAVLDVGTGPGVAAIAAREAMGQEGFVVGVDPSLGMLRRARERDAGIALAAAIAIDLPFPDATFDVAVSNFVVSHFPDARTALADIHRVLKPGGRLGISAWVAEEDEFDRTFREVAERWAEQELLQDARAAALPSLSRLTDPGAIDQTLRDAGFHDLDIRRQRYQFSRSQEEFVREESAGSTGRFLREMLGEELWPKFMDDLARTFAERFPERLNDFDQAYLATATRRG